MRLVHKLIGSLGRAREHVLETMDIMDDAPHDEWDADLYEKTANVLADLDELLDEVMNG